MKCLTLLTPLALLTILIFSSCKKVQPLEIPVEEVNITTPPTTTTPSEVPKVYNRIIEIGTGSGSLVLDGKKFILQCNDLIKIKGGKYKSIDIKNIISDDGCPITIKNEGQVELSGDFNQLTLENLKNVIISGDGSPSITKGFLFKDNKFRAVQAFGTLDKFTLQHIQFENIGDADFSFQYQTLYNGTEESYSKDLKFLNISCNNTGQFIGTSGHTIDGVITGLIRNIEIAYLDFQNSPSVGSVVYLGNVENYNVHNNRVNNVNTNLNNHNGIFSLIGNGSFYNNHISNHQGNSLRAWPHSIGTIPKDVYIYNNIVVNSRKYSAFEVQSFDATISAGKSTYANAIIFNNTIGNLNTSRDWQGNVVDIYNLKGGKCEVYNNVAFNMQDDYGIAGLINQQITKVFNNRYYNTSEQAGIIDEVSFKLNSNSALKKAGASTAFLIKDFYGEPRNSTPSIGAVE